MNKHIFEDAKRCLQCKMPLCTKGCPVGTPIRDVIKLLLESKISEAGELLLSNNPLSLVCSYVCPQENQCEGHCVLGRKSSPVHISAIEQYISNYYLNLYSPKKSNKTSGKLAIIGSGPAGITISKLLAERDYDVTIFEGNELIGGILRYGIPEFRLPKDILDKITKSLVDAGVTIRPNTTIGTTLTVDDLFRDGYQAIFIGTGVWKPVKLNIPGESLGHVHYAIDYLRNPEVYNLGNSVTIIGAGNVAMDVARTAIRKGAKDVNILYYKGDEQIPARRVEVEYAKMDGVKFNFFKNACEITEDGIVYQDTEITTLEDGKIKVTNIEGSEKLFLTDSVIIAVSQGPRSLIVDSTKGININKKGLVETDEVGKTTRTGVFSSGDVVTGAKTVVEAVRLSKKVADAIDEYIKGL